MEHHKPAQLFLMLINKGLNILALIILIAVFAIDLGYVAYALFFFLILLHSILLLWTISEQRKEKTHTYLLYLILFLTIAPYTVIVFFI